MSNFFEKFLNDKSLKMTYQDHLYDFSKLLNYFQKLEVYFKKENVVAGDTIFFKGEVHPLQLLLLFVCEKMGLVFMPCSLRVTPFEQANIITDIQPQWIFEQDGFDFKLSRNSPSVLKNLQQGGCLFQTSGTTGSPSFILQPFTNMYANALNTIRGQNILPTSKVLSLLPLSHVGGLCMQTTGALVSGCHLILADRNNLQKFALDLGEATHCALVPAYIRMLNQISVFKDNKYSNAPFVLTGSTSISEKIFSTYKEKGFKVQSVYGLTEVGPYVCTVSDQVKEPVPGSISYLGKPVPGYEMRISTETGQIEIKGPCVGLKFNSHDKTFGSMIRSDGFFATGDLGVEVNQEFYYSGRMNNLINVGGHKVNTAEIEYVLNLFPSVTQCAVIGIPHHTLEEIPKAFIVGKPEDKQAIMKHLKDHLSDYKIPRKIEFLDQLPMTSSGKVATGELKKRQANEN